MPGGIWKDPGPAGRMPDSDNQWRVCCRQVWVKVTLSCFRDLATHTGGGGATTQATEWLRILILPSVLPPASGLTSLSLRFFVGKGDHRMARSPGLWERRMA